MILITLIWYSCLQKYRALYEGSLPHWLIRVLQRPGANPGAKQCQQRAVLRSSSQDSKQPTRNHGVLGRSGRRLRFWGIPRCFHIYSCIPDQCNKDTPTNSGKCSLRSELTNCESLYRFQIIPDNFVETYKIHCICVIRRLLTVTYSAE